MKVENSKGASRPPVTRREAILRAGAAVVGLGMLGCHSVELNRPMPKRVLFFSKSSSFEHPVITRHGDDFSLAEKALLDLGSRHGLEFTCSKDGSLFVPGYLARFAAFVFYTSGDLTVRGTDKNPPMTPAGKSALLQAIWQGTGFVGIHSATDTFGTSRPASQGAAGRLRPYQNDGNAADPYIQMIGGEFIAHGESQKGRMHVTDPAFPGNRREDFELMEEWYSFKNFAPDLRVLLAQETEGMAGDPYRRPPYPATWARMHGRGRVFYTSMGHREDVWANPLFQEILFGGIAWAVGDVEAEVNPNINTVTPGYSRACPQSACF